MAVADYRYITNRGQWFDADRARVFAVDGGDTMYFTRHDHFILFTPAGTGEDITPEQYNSVKPAVGVTWMQANGFANDITGKMKKLVEDKEY